MKNLKGYLLCVFIIIAIDSCKKTVYESAPTATELLTTKAWKLISFGYDNNKNGIVDSNEEIILNCEKDNTYKFNTDGSGVVNENASVCNGGAATTQFNWTFRNNNSLIDFVFGSANILKLSSDSLIISDANSTQVKLLSLYTH